MYDEQFYNTLPHGEERLDYLKKCIAEADKEKDAKNMLELRHEYIQESTFHDDCFKAIIMFPEFMKLFDENPGIIEPYHFMFPFKWILEDSVEYYQVTLEQLDRYFERFKEYIEKFGYTLRTYYLKMYQTYINIDRQKAFDAFRRYEDYERTDMSDCKACEMNAKISHEIEFGSEKKAVAMLNSMLDKNISCSEVPQVTYGKFIEIFSKRGIYDEAEHYSNLLMPMIKGDEVNYMRDVSSVLILKSKTDMNYAIDLFSGCAGDYSRLKNPFLKFSFANAAYRMFKTIEKEDVKEIFLHLPSDFEKHNAEGRYDTSEMKKYFYDTAKDLAEKFDTRSGNDHFMQELEFDYPEASEKKIVLIPHGSVTPAPAAIGILFRNIENTPSPEEYIPKAEKTLGYRDSQLQMIKDTGTLFYSANSDEGMVRYRIVYTECPDISSFRQVHYMPEGAMEQLEEYKGMIAVLPDITNPDRFQEIGNLLRFADLLNTDGSPAVLMLSNEKILSSKWVSMTAKSKTPPASSMCVGIKLFASAFEDGKCDIVTLGMGVFGSRELIVTAVDEDDVNFTVAMLKKICEEVMLRKLPDENVSMNSGMVYENRAFVRFTWKAVVIPDIEDPEPFAEPILYLTASDQANHKGYKINELSDEQLNNTTPRKHRKISDYDEQRCRMLFPYALEYFRNHQCQITVGVNADGTDDEGEKTESYFFAELKEDGLSGDVVSAGEDIDGINVGDTVDIDAEKVYYFSIIADGEEYAADELYFIMDI